MWVGGAGDASGAGGTFSDGRYIATVSRNVGAVSTAHHAQRVKSALISSKATEANSVHHHKLTPYTINNNTGNWNETACPEPMHPLHQASLYWLTVSLLEHCTSPIVPKCTELSLGMDHLATPGSGCFDCSHTLTHTHNTIVLLLFWNLSGTTWVSRYQKGKTRKGNWFTGARDSEWQWHLLGYMQRLLPSTSCKVSPCGRHMGSPHPP